ncbi:MAG TPA: flagellar basal body protein [Candidatus Sulfotelmatobacter sp.]|nr:flagellar basal body protein [Candidatus Sulfotelmatobacter sp.]
MSLFDIPDLLFLERYLDLTSYRQTLVAANLANVDTPGYRTRDVPFRATLQWASFSGFEAPLSPMPQPVYGLTERPDGNNVSLDREGLLLAQTQLQYKTAIEFIRSDFRTLHGAINDGVES